MIDESVGRNSPRVKVVSQAADAWVHLQQSKMRGVFSSMGNSVANFLCKSRSSNSTVMLLTPPKANERREDDRYARVQY